MEVKKIKALFIKLTQAEKASEKLERLCDMDILNEELEQQSDIAYQEVYNIFEELTNLIAKTIKVDLKTARTMVSERRNELTSLFNRIQQ